jgi:glycosyltransferase involved in cell wall biosynthesis
MRILMVSFGYPPILSGVTLVAQKLARAMVQKGHQVVMVTSSEHGEAYDDQDRGVCLVRVRSRPNPFWRGGPVPFIGQNDLDELVDSFRPHILHTHDAATLGLQIVRLNHTSHIPRVATVHYVPRFAARYLTWNGDPQELVETLVWQYSTWLFNRFDHVVFATEAHRDRFVRKGLKTPSTIISNGVDMRRYRPVNGHQEELDIRYGLPPGPRILFVSRLAKDKEIDVLIRAMRPLSHRLAAHLLVVGKGDDGPRLEALVAELGLRHCVHFPGFIPEEDLPALYRAADLFAISSTCEVQSLPTLQALATGLPVVAADAVALPELVKDGVNGLLVPPGEPQAMAEAIAYVLADRSLAAQMGQASLSMAQAHAEERTYGAYENLYRAAISRPFRSAVGPSPSPGLPVRHPDRQPMGQPRL